MSFRKKLLDNPIILPDKMNMKLTHKVCETGETSQWNVNYFHGTMEYPGGHGIRGICKISEETLKRFLNESPALL